MTIKQFFERVFDRFKRFFPQWRVYGFPVAFWSLLIPLDRLFANRKPYISFQKHRVILKYLTIHYTDIISSFASRNTIPASSIDPASTIWVCWWDGAESMPDIVKVCYNNLLSYANTHPVQLITKHNFMDFISIPEYILEKVSRGTITVTHFSDILRAALLFEYGGVWMDATILTLKDISFANQPFFTLKTTTKTNSISHIRWQGLSHDASRFHTQTSQEVNRWSGFLLAGTRHSLLFEFMRDFFYRYWNGENSLIDYLFIDYVLAIACDFMPDINKMINDVPCSDIDKFGLEKKLNSEFTNEEFIKYSAITFHKLTWKKKFDVYTKDQKLTIYGHLLGQPS